jgi:hypothetical protein
MWHHLDVPVQDRTPMSRRIRVAALVSLGGLSLTSCGAVALHPPGRSGTQALDVTSAVRAGLLRDGAAFHHLATSDFVGLAAGSVYYAYDPATRRYYAAAGLRASPHSLAAQVGTQDDGAYNLFVRARGAARWTVYDDGLGAVQGATCPTTLPASVRRVWHWPTRGCYPPTR